MVNKVKKIDRQSLRQQIQELNIDNDIKAQLLSLVAEQKRYGLVSIILYSDEY